MNAAEFLVWCMANEEITDEQFKLKYETICETQQHSLQRAVQKYGLPDMSLTRIIGDDNYE